MEVYWVLESVRGNKIINTFHGNKFSMNTCAYASIYMFTLMSMTKQQPFTDLFAKIYIIN